MSVIFDAFAGTNCWKFSSGRVCAAATYGNSRQTSPNRTAARRCTKGCFFWTCLIVGLLKVPGLCSCLYTRCVTAFVRVHPLGTINAERHQSATSHSIKSNDFGCESACKLQKSIPTVTNFYSDCLLFFTTPVTVFATRCLKLACECLLIVLFTLRPAMSL